MDGYFLTLCVVHSKIISLLKVELQNNAIIFQKDDRMPHCGIMFASVNIKTTSSLE
jgi:hypothetical protein